jgi:uncharacterized protein (DUF433 family)
MPSTSGCGKENRTMAVLETLTAKPPPLRVDEDGVVRVGVTRVTLDTVVGAFKQGCDPEEIRLKYPTLDLTDIYSVIVYYLWHPEEVEEYLEQRRLRAEEVRRENEARWPPQEMRERLLARRNPS